MQKWYAFIVICCRLRQLFKIKRVTKNQYKLMVKIYLKTLKAL